MYILYIIMLNFFIFIYIKISILTHIYYFILKLHEICQKINFFSFTNNPSPIICGDLPGR